MGQYYRPVIIDRNKKITIGNSFDFANGQKLMEHSWVGNNFLNSAIHKILNNPCRVAWVGDYSDSVVNKSTKFSNMTDFGLDEFMEIFENIWHKFDEEIEYDWLKPCEDYIISCDKSDSNDFILINHSKGVFINLSEYINKNTHYDSEHNGWCVNPISVLTCIGNGLGNGDYEGTNMELVGSWCFDAIEIVAVEDFTNTNYEDVTDKIILEDRVFY